MSREAGDHELLVQFQRGDHNALRDLYQRHKNPLFFYLNSLLQDGDSASDVLQELFLDVFRRPNHYTQAQDIKAYLFGAARQIACSYIRSEDRRRHKQQQIPSAATWFTADTSSGPLALPGAVDRLETALRQLPDEQREVITMRVYEEFSFQQIADLTASPVQTVFSRYQNGLVKLKKDLQTQGLDPDA